MFNLVNNRNEYICTLPFAEPNALKVASFINNNVSSIRTSDAEGTNHSLGHEINKNGGLELLLCILFPDIVYQA